MVNPNIIHKDGDIIILELVNQIYIHWILSKRFIKIQINCHALQLTIQF